MYKGKRYTNCMGNYWDDYTGSDAYSDGIGDVPYRIGELTNNNLPEQYLTFSNDF